jgi:glycerol-3-phosphate acyltransferase PlsY
MIVGQYIAVAVIGYLLGSIPFGVIIGRLMGGKDVRKIGSGKTGMTNVMRAAGRKAAALSLLLDMGKGALAVYLATLIMGEGHEAPAGAVAALTAIAGHSWSVFLGFKGGRGVATFLGGLLVMHWPAAVIGGLIMIFVGVITKYMSLGSITGAVAAFVMLIVLNFFELNFLKTYPPIEYVIYAMICAIFIYIMHRDNILRLVSGTERKLGEKAEAKNPTQPGNQE